MATPLLVADVNPSDISPRILGTLNGNVVFDTYGPFPDVPYNASDYLKLWIESQEGATEFLSTFWSFPDFAIAGIINNGTEDLLLFSADGQIWATSGLNNTPINLGNYNHGLTGRTPVTGSRGQNFGNKIIFTNEENNNLFVTDGTPQGSFILHESGSFSGTVGHISPTNIGTGFVFTTSSNDANNNTIYESWYSDGVSGNPLKRIGEKSLQVNGVSEDNSIVWLTDTRTGELWASDSNISSLSLIGNSASASGSVIGNQLFYNSGSLGPNGEEYGGNELWISDGTVEGTRILKDIQNETGYGYGEPEGLIRVGETIVYGGADQFHGYELWATDGTEEGTRLLKDINSNEGTYYVNTGGSFVYPDSGVIHEGYLYFLGYQSNSSGRGTQNIWRTDGTEANTELVLDVSFFASYGWSSTNYLTSSDTSLYFTAENDQYGTEVWKLNFADIGTTIDSSQFTFTASAEAIDASISNTSFVNVNGNALDNTITGNSLDNLINPGDGNDVVSAGPGSDEIIGGSGAGDDVYNGEEGLDTVIYSSTTLGVTVNLQEGTAVGPEVDNDTLISIENVVFGLGENHFWGNSESNYVVGTAGDNDTAHFALPFNSYEILKKGPLDNHYFIDNDDFVNIEYFDFNGQLYGHDSSASSLVPALLDQGVGTAGLITSTGDLQEGVALSAPVVTDDPDGDLVLWDNANPEYQWLQDGAVIDGATASTYTVPADAISTNDQSADYAVEITYSDLEGFRNTASPVTANSVSVSQIDNGVASYQLQVNDAPLTGTASLNTPITATLLEEDPDGAGSDVVYSWETQATSADPWTPVGTNTNTFTPTAELAGQELQLTIEYTDGQNHPTILAPLGTTIEQDNQVDLITGTLKAPKKIDLEGRGRKKLVLYGSEEINVRDIELDSVIFGGDANELMNPVPERGDYFGIATRKRKGRVKYQSKIRDINNDSFEDLIVRARVADMNPVLDNDDNKIFAYANIGETNALFESNPINFI